MKEFIVTKTVTYDMTIEAEDIVMNTKEMAEAHNKEVEYCYSEINKALDLMRYVDDSTGRLDEAKDILENISLGTFILEVSK